MVMAIRFKVRNFLALHQKLGLDADQVRALTKICWWANQIVQGDNNQTDPCKIILVLCHPYDCFLCMYLFFSAAAAHFRAGCSFPAALFSTKDNFTWTTVWFMSVGFLVFCYDEKGKCNTGSIKGATRRSSPGFLLLLNDTATSQLCGLISEMLWGHSLVQCRL